MIDPDFIVPPPERGVPGFRAPGAIRPPSALPIAPLGSEAPQTRLSPPAPGGPPSRPAPAPAPTGEWRLRNADGVEFAVPGQVIAGRDPKAPAWLPDAALVVIPDPTRSMSKTHALIDASDGRLRVIDLDSTNGVRVWPEGEDPVDLEPGVPAEVPLDAVVLLGDVAFLVERAPGESV